MASHNNGRFIGQAIQSVLNQTYRNWQLIIVENASTDDSPRLASSAGRLDGRIQVHGLPQKRPIAAVMNLGLAYARGEYVAVLDSDDAWLPNRLARQISLLEGNGGAGVGVCGCSALLVNERGDEIGSKRFPLSHEDCLRALWYRNPFCHSAVLIRKPLLDELGAYDETLEAAFDLELWLRLSRSCQLRNLPECLVKYRLRERSASILWHRRMIQNTLKVRRLAVQKYGHRLTPLRRCGLTLTWVTQWLPPPLVRALFYRLVLPLASCSDNVARSECVFDKPEARRSSVASRQV